MRYPCPHPRAARLRFFDQFKSLLIVVLMVTASLAALVGNVKGATVIPAVVLPNAALGFHQGYRAERSMAALRGMLPVRAKVRRDGATSEIDAKSLVRGDVLLLEAGDRIPADGRLIQAASFAIDKSSLTGGSQPVQKEAGSAEPLDAPLAERHNMTFMNALVTRGRPEVVVTQTTETDIRWSSIFDHLNSG